MSGFGPLGSSGGQVFALLGFFELKQLNEITRRVLQEPGAPCAGLAHLSLEFCSGACQPINESVDTVRYEHDPVPPARFRITARGASASSAGSAQIERKVIPL